MSSSDLFIHNNDSLFRCSSSDMSFPSDAELQIFSDAPYSPFSDSAIDILQAISSDHNYSNHPFDESRFSSTFLSSSSSPPSQQLESLSLYQQKDDNDFNRHLFPNHDWFYQKFSCFNNDLEVKNEEFNNNNYVGFCSSDSNNPPLETTLCYDNNNNNNNNNGGENVLDKAFLQRSFSIDQAAAAASLMESPNFHNPENHFFSSQIRRVFSTGDLQNGSNSRQRCFSRPLSENSLVEETNFKVGKYSAEERKERISKYRAKRTQRNFNKTIKYACRKTLADNRPRIRGRFARNDEPGDISKAACSNRDEDEDDLWMEELHGGEDEGRVRGKHYGQMQFHYCGFS